MGVGVALSPLDMAAPHVQRRLGCPSRGTGRPLCLSLGISHARQRLPCSMCRGKSGRSRGRRAPGAAGSWLECGPAIKRGLSRCLVANEVWAGSRRSTSASISAAAKIWPWLQQKGWGKGVVGSRAPQPAAALGQWRLIAQKIHIPGFVLQICGSLCASAFNPRI